MSKNRKHRKHSPFLPEGEAQTLYRRARECASLGRLDESRSLYESLLPAVSQPRLKAIVSNDKAALAAVAGDLNAARQGFEEALTADPECEAARLNLALVETDLACAPQPVPQAAAEAHSPENPALSGPVKVAIVSFLFNWPSTGGGIVHTVELAQFLAAAGYEVRHIYARYAPWGIGRSEVPLPFPSEAVEFDEASWNLPAIQGRFRQAVDAFAPDFALITDSWNMKPLLAEALRGYRILLRLQAMECICPLNNVRLLPEAGGRFLQCRLDQLASPASTRSS